MTELFVAERCKAFAEQCAQVPMNQRNSAEYRELFAEYAAACFELRRIR